MNFNFSPVKIFRIFLLPFSLLYRLIVIIRNYLFDKNILKSVSFNLPIIAVGNLSLGGTGKSPMVEYLLTLLKDKYNIAVLSRGYKRKTKGYVLAGAATTALELGDEPMQFHQKFPGVAVAVGEERILAVPQILQDRPETNVIILDDAFQHRSVKPGFNILLTDYNNLFTRDFFLPAGNLRDQQSSYKRADVIIVTKCPANLPEEEKNEIRKEINLLPNQKIFFTAIKYGSPYHIITKEKKTITAKDEVLLVCGIADPKPLKKYLLQHSKSFYEQSFPDHHIFTNNNIKEIRKKYDNIKAVQKIIITTEKDAVRLIKLKEKLSKMPVFVLPVQHTFLFNEGIQFDGIIHSFIETFEINKR